MHSSLMIPYPSTCIHECGQVCTAIFSASKCMHFLADLTIAASTHKPVSTAINYNRYTITIDAKDALATQGCYIQASFDWRIPETVCDCSRNLARTLQQQEAYCTYNWGISQTGTRNNPRIPRQQKSCCLTCNSTDEMMYIHLHQIYMEIYMYNLE